MLLAFLHVTEEALRKFLRKPDKPGKRLTNYATQHFNTAKKYWRLIEKLGKLCPDNDEARSRPDTISYFKERLERAEEIYTRLRK
jgi:hypothetical protein